MSRMPRRLPEPAPAGAGALPCGAPVADLSDQVAQGPAGRRSAHQRTCPYCREVLAGLEHDAALVERLRREPVAPPPDLLGRVMRRVRATAPSGGYAAAAAGPGATRVAGTAVAVVALLAAAETPGVHEVLLARAAPAVGEDRGRAPGGDAPPVRLELELAVVYGRPAAAVAGAVRRTVATTVRRLTGVRVGRVDVTVADVATG